MTVVREPRPSLPATAPRQAARRPGPPAGRSTPSGRADRPPRACCSRRWRPTRNATHSGGRPVGPAAIRPDPGTCPPGCVTAPGERSTETGRRNPRPAERRRPRGRPPGCPQPQRASCQCPRPPGTRSFPGGTADRSRCRDGSHRSRPGTETGRQGRRSWRPGRRLPRRHRPGYRRRRPPAAIGGWMSLRRIPLRKSQHSCSNPPAASWGRSLSGPGVHEMAR